MNKNSRILFIFFLFVNSFTTILISFEQIYSETISALIKQYKRPITVLEISADNLDYSRIMARNYHHASWIGISSNASIISSFNHQCNKDSTKNIVLTNPKIIDQSLIQTLGRCEHFDIVLVHNQESFMNSREDIELLVALGDYVFFETAQPHLKVLLEQEQPHGTVPCGNSMLYLFNIPKKGLDIARWHQKKLPHLSTPRYQVHSTFTEKYLNKNGNKTTWLQGINLLTFVFLRGKRPSGEVLVEQLKMMKHLKHNDLVIGNMIVQGLKIFPIDFNDLRRDIRARKCIKAAIKLFTENLRFTNPEAAMDVYYSKLVKPKN